MMVKDVLSATILLACQSLQNIAVPHHIYILYALSVIALKQTMPERVMKVGNPSVSLLLAGSLFIVAMHMLCYAEINCVSLPSDAYVCHKFFLASNIDTGGAFY